MQDLLVALTILTIFAVMWIVTFVASAIVLANRAAKRNRVLPGEPTTAPTLWLWSPLPPARLHRRLQAVGGAAQRSAAHPLESIGYDPDPASLDDIARQVAYQALVLDAAVVRATRMPAGERRYEMRRLNGQVRECERAADRLTGHLRPAGVPSSGFTFSEPNTDQHLTALHDRLDRIDSARAELAAIEQTLLYPEQVLPQHHPELTPTTPHA